MGNPVWSEARKRARAETLELIRLNDPARALLTIGSPLVAFIAARLMLGQWAIATGAAVVATLAFAFLIYTWKLIAAPAKIAAEQKAHAEELEAQITAGRQTARQAYMIDLVRRIIRSYMPDEGLSHEIYMGLALPPADWINAQLGKHGETFFVTTDRHLFTVYDPV